MLYDLIKSESESLTFLHGDLVNFHVDLLDNYISYKKNTHCSLKPIFVTFDDEKEFNDVNGWTKSKLALKTFELINDFIDSDLLSYYESCHTAIKSALKCDQVQFYYEVLDTLVAEKESVDNFDEEQEYFISHQLFCLNTATAHIIPAQFS